MTTTLYAIPGTQCNREIWQKLIPELPSSVKLVHLDIPQNMDFDEIVSHFATLVEGEDIHLLGLSLGGYIATYFAKAYPSRMAKLMVIGNSPTSLPDNELRMREQTAALIEKRQISGMTRERAAMYFNSDAEVEPLIDIVLEMDNRLGAQALVNQFRYTSKRLDLSAAVGGFTFPSYFCFSEHDPLVKRQWFAQAASANSQVTLVPFAGRSHLLPLEKPKALAAVIQRWLSA